MKRGDLVKLVPVEPYPVDFRVLAKEPNKRTWSAICFYSTEIGTVLNWKKIEHIWWIKVLCPSGIGWILHNHVKVV